jgi:hypothetical protein
VKLYGAFIVSDQPIDLSHLEGRRKTGYYEHLINLEFDVDTASSVGVVVTSSTGEHAKPPAREIRVAGASVSVAIARWFLDLVSSIGYRPLRDRLKN